MKIITTREIRREMKTFFEMAERERVVVKRGKKYVNLIVTENPDTKFVTEEWVKEFISIPEEYRINPFEISPSGDLFYADKRNVEHLKMAMDQARNGELNIMTKEEQKEIFK